MRALLLLLALAGCHGQVVNWSPDPPWSHAPISVRSDVAPVYADSIAYARASWNHAAGCTVLVATPSFDADVLVTDYEGSACGAGANLEAWPDSTAGTWRCSAEHAEVRFRSMSDIRSVAVVAMHELGHALGLDHDRSAVMRPDPQLYEPQNVGGSLGLLPWPSDADGAAVASRYCGRR